MRGETDVADVCDERVHKVGGQPLEVRETGGTSYVLNVSIAMVVGEGSVDHPIDGGSASISLGVGEAHDVQDLM